MDEKHFMTSSNNNDVFLPTNIGSFQLQVVVWFFPLYTYALGTVFLFGFCVVYALLVVLFIYNYGYVFMLVNPKTIYEGIKSKMIQYMWYILCFYWLRINIHHNHIFLEYSSMKVTKYLASSMAAVLMGSHMSKCTICKSLVARLHPCLKLPPNVVYLQCMLCKTMRMWDFFLPRFMALTIFYSLWTPFMFKWLRQRCKSSNTPSPIKNCAFPLCIFS
jgi:hypothetical protein